MVGLFKNTGEQEETVAPELTQVVKALEGNKKAVNRWFFRFLLAFNLLAWSAALPIAFLRSI